MMGELISRDWVLKNLFFDVDKEVVRKAPKVDAVEVVRCKDCKHYKDRMCELIGNIMDGYYHGTFDVKRPDDFCSYGAKMDGGDDDG